MPLSPTRYAEGPRGRIAHRVHGSDEIAVVLLTWWGRSIDGLDDHPGALRLFRYLEPLGGCLVLDPRGVGVSDPLASDETPDRETWADDVAAVMDHLSCGPRPFIAEELAGHAALALAARAPERVQRVLVLNGYLRTGLTDDAIARQVAHLESVWGTGVLAGGIGDHGSDLEAGARAERLAASPRMAAAWLDAQLRSDASDLVAAVDVPVLVTSIADAGSLPERHAKDLAAAIPGAEFRHLDGPRLYTGDDEGDAVVTWLTGRAPASGDRALVTLLFTDVVGSTASTAADGDHRWRQVIDQLDALVGAHVRRCHGRVVKQTGDGHLAEFTTPSDAVRCGQRIVASVSELGVAVRVGVHAGEVERRAGDDIAGLTVDIAARIEQLARPGEVLVSRATADLVGGVGFAFVDRGEHELKGVPGRWALLGVAT